MARNAAVQNGVSRFFGGLARVIVGTIAFTTGALGATWAEPPTEQILIFNRYGDQLGRFAVTVRADAIPSNALPSSAIPANMRSGSQALIWTNDQSYQFDASGLFLAIPANAIPANALPSSAIPSNAIPSNALPSSALPSSYKNDQYFVIGLRAIPSNAKLTIREALGTEAYYILNAAGYQLGDGKLAIPSNAIPSNAIPSNGIPSNLLDGDQMLINIADMRVRFFPAGLVRAIPANAIPSNALPSSAIPSNAIPSDALPATALPSNYADYNWFVMGLQAIPSNIKINVADMLGARSLAITSYYQIEIDQSELVEESNIFTTLGMQSKRMRVYQPLGEQICGGAASCGQTVTAGGDARLWGSELAYAPASLCDEDLSSAQVGLNSAAESPDLVVNIRNATGFFGRNYVVDYGFSLPNGVEVGRLPCAFFSATHMYCYGGPPPAGATRVSVTLRPSEESCALLEAAFDLGGSLAGTGTETLPGGVGPEMAYVDLLACGPASTLTFVRLNGNLARMQDVALVFRAEGVALRDQDAYTAAFTPVNASSGAEQLIQSACATDVALGEIACPLPLGIVIASQDFVVRVAHSVPNCPAIFRMAVDLAPVQSGTPAAATGETASCPDLPDAAFVNFLQRYRTDTQGLDTISGKAIFRLPTDADLTGSFWMWSPHALGFWYSQPCVWDPAEQLISCATFHQDSGTTSRYLLTYQQGDMPGNACDQTVRQGNHATDVVGSEMVYAGGGDRCGLVWPTMKLILTEYRSTPAAPNNLLDVYIKMTGGIPGVTANASTGSEQAWRYRLQLAGGSPMDCAVYQSHPDRLYCPVLPTGAQENSLQTFQLYVDGCAAAVRTFANQSIPSRSGTSSVTSTGSEMAPTPSCPSGESYHEGWGCCTIGCWCEIAGETGCWNNCPDCP